MSKPFGNTYEVTVTKIGTVRVAADSEDEARREAETLSDSCITWMPFAVTDTQLTD